MTGFAIRFLACNLCISVIIVLLFAVKSLLGKRLTSRSQYRLCSAFWPCRSCRWSISGFRHFQHGSMHGSRRMHPPRHPAISRIPCFLPEKAQGG